MKIEIIKNDLFVQKKDAYYSHDGFLALQQFFPLASIVPGGSVGHLVEYSRAIWDKNYKCFYCRFVSEVKKPIW